MSYLYLNLSARFVPSRFVCPQKGPDFRCPNSQQMHLQINIRLNNIPLFCEKGDIKNCERFSVMLKITYQLNSLDHKLYDSAFMRSNATNATNSGHTYLYDFVFRYLLPVCQKA